MVKKYWKQIAAFALAFALIFQNSASLLKVAATETKETTTNQGSTDTSNSGTTDGTDTEENSTDNKSETDTDSTNAEENETTSETEESNTESTETDATTNVTTSPESTTTETTEEPATTESTAQPASTTESDSEAETTSSETTSQENTQEVGDTTVVIDSVTYEISDGFSQSQLPANFSTTTMEYNGNTVSAAKSNNGELYLLYLVKEGSYNGDFYVYDQTSKSAYEFQTIGDDENYIIVLKTPENETVPEGFAETSLMLEEETITAYRYSGTVASNTTTETQSSNEQAGVSTETTTSAEESSETASTTSETQTTTDSANTDTTTTDGNASEEKTSESSLSPADFYLIYGMSSGGYQGWFQYDAGLNSYLRYLEFDSGEEETTGTDASSEDIKSVQEKLDNITDKYNNEMKNRILIFSGFIILIFILIIIITGLIFKVRDLKHKDEWDDDDDDDSNGGTGTWNDDYDYDVNDEEDYNQESSAPVDSDIPDESDVPENVEEGLENGKKKQNINTNNRTPQSTMFSGSGEKDSIHAKDFSPSMEISSDEAMMGESELAREVAKAMNGEFEKPKQVVTESEDDNFNFEFVDLD